jgi:pectate lyase
MHSSLNNLIKVLGLLTVLLFAPLAWAAPTITSQSHTGTVNVNYGSSVTMSVVASGTGALTYQWYVGPDISLTAIAGATSASYTVPYLQEPWSNQTIFRVRVTDSTGSVDSAAIFLNAQNIPSLTFVTQPSPASQSVAADTVVSFTYTFRGSFSVTETSLLTSPGGVAVGTGRLNTTTTRGSDGVHSATTTIRVGVADTGTYVLRLNNNFYGVSSTDSSAITLTVTETAPAITSHPIGATVHVGSGGYDIGVAATGTNLSYQWKKDGVNIAGAIFPTYRLPATSAAESGSYTVTVSNSAGSVTSNAAVMDVVLLSAPTIVTQPVSQSIILGSPVAFTVTPANGVQVSGIQWKKDGVDIPNATNLSYSIPAVSAGSAGSYSVTLSNSVGSVTSSAAVLTVLIPPSITTQPASQTVNLEASATFTVAATGSAPLTYQWKKGGVDIAGATSASYAIAATNAGSAGSYTVTVTNAGGSVTSNAATLTVTFPLPRITTQPVNTAVTVGSAVSLNVVATTDFSTGAGSTPRYQWFKDGLGITNAEAATYSIANALTGSAGTYYVLAYNSYGSVESQRVTLTVNPLVITTQPVSQTVTAGASATFTVASTGENLSHQWFHNGSPITDATSASCTIAMTSAASAGSYTVTISTTGGGVTSNAAVLTVNIPPAITTQPASQSVTAGASALFSVTATGSATLTYQWRKDGVNIGGATSATYSIPTTTTASAGSYTVVVTNSVGAVTSSAATLTVAAAPSAPVITTQPASQTVNAGSSATITVVATGTDLTYQWFRNGISISGATAASYTINPVSSASAGNYTVNVSNSLGNVTSSTATLTVLPVFTAPAADGYAASVTGGGTATTTNHTVVTTAADFRTLAESTAANAAVITVSGTLNLGATKVAVKSNKTIQGIDGNATLVGNLELASGVSNVVIRGLNISNTAGAGITLTGATNVYITHVTFFDCSDTLLRIVGGSDNVTASWCEFYFSAATGTRQALLIGATTGETKAIKVTLSHNWFADRVDQQQPDSTWGQIHAYNNYFNPNGTNPTGTVNTSGTIVRANAQLLSERNQYTSVVSPLTKTGGGLIRTIGNAYTTTTGTAADAGTDTVFTPSYSYRLLPVASVASQIAASAGNTAGADSTSASTSSSSINASGTAIVTGTSFTLNSVTPISATVAYQWRLNNADIAGATSASYTVASAQAANAGIYTVVSSNSAGDSLVSSPVTITVGAAPSNPPASGGGGGGGSPSLWFFAALASLAGLRRLTRKS